MTRGGWGTTWRAGIAICVLLLALIETGWRAGGYRGSARDDAGLWTLTRRAANGDDATLVLIGSSRLHYAMDHATIRQMYPGTEVVQLTIAAGDALPALRNLSNDPQFRGSILVDIRPPNLLESLERSDEYLKHYLSRGNNWNSLANRWLTNQLDRAFVFRRSHLSLHRVVAAAVDGRLPENPFLRVTSRRMGLLDFTMIEDLEAFRRMTIDNRRQLMEPWTRQAPSTTEFADSVESVAAMVRRIEGRGGRVAFLMSPMAEKLWELEESLFPRSLFWDVFSAHIGTATVHYRDYAELRDFDLPDGSHIDCRDPAAYTRIVFRLLAAEGFVPGTTTLRER